MPRRVLVSRADPEPLAALLREGGAEPVHIALIGTRPTISTPPPGRPGAVLLSSASALAAGPDLLHFLQGIPVVAVGAATAQAAAAAGLEVVATGGAGGAEAVSLAERIAPGDWWHVGARALSPPLEAALRPHAVPRWIVYETRALAASAAIEAALPLDVLTFASGSAARAFAAQASQGQARVAAIGASTAEEARAAGLEVHAIARQPSLAALAAAALSLLPRATA